MKTFRIIYCQPNISPLEYEYYLVAKDEADARYKFDRTAISTSKIEITSCDEILTGESQ